jgi:hypothetical protein
MQRFENGWNCRPAKYFSLKNASHSIRAFECQKQNKKGRTKPQEKEGKKSRKTPEKTCSGKVGGK